MECRRHGPGFLRAGHPQVSYHITRDTAGWKDEMPEDWSLKFKCLKRTREVTKGKTTGSGEVCAQMKVNTQNKSIKILF